MANVSSQKNRVKAHIHLVKAGYSEAPEGGLFLYNMDDLNRDGFDFKTAQLKTVAKEVKISEKGDEIEWQELDTKRPLLNVTTKTSATVFTADASNVIAGEELFCQSTQETAYVKSVAGAVVTLESPWFVGAAYVNGSKIVRIGFAKIYGADDSLHIDENDTAVYTNYYQFTERLVKGDLIENNQSYLFYDTPEDKQAEEYTRHSRSIMEEMIGNFFVGKKSKIPVGSKFRYTAAGLASFIPVSAKVNITGVDDAATKTELENQLSLAYQSGLSGLMAGSNKLLAVCNSKFSSKVNRLYEWVQRQDVEVLKSTGVNIRHIDANGFDMNIVRSGILDRLYGDTAICFLVPIDYLGIQMFPNGRVAEDGKHLMKFGTGVVYEKPIVTYETSEHALFTAYTFVFKGVSTGAFRQLTMT